MTRGDISWRHTAYLHCAKQLQALVGAGAEELLLHPLYDVERQREALPSVMQLVDDTAT